ncbi:cysteine hydrolase family protein [Desulforhopalus singaporensis]|uniref:Nicotinamidase-related amidase n=1 Tax=Desulforhopalus singaporensis TaxID=91360 RepID=A0A1H0V3C2_9BACT|nr:cysteine hydrolase family protein [Desulforhopalus singaporensis]SDP72576.1 Nicotinamidase-related amidase [Desulforhopalus singaporensis]
MKAYFNGVRKNITDKMSELYLNPEKTAIVTIDMCMGHLSEAPEAPCPAPRARQIVEPINSFTSTCRKLGIPVINVRSTLRADGSDDINGNISAWRLTFPMTTGSIPGIDQHAIEESQWCDFGIDVQDNDYIVSGKKRLSAFYTTDLELLIRNLRKEVIVLTGAMTDCCVLNTAFDGANRDFRVIVPRDLCRGFEDMEESALRIISLYLGLVLDSDELVTEWETSTGRN